MNLETFVRNPERFLESTHYQGDELILFFTGKGRLAPDEFFSRFHFMGITNDRDVCFGYPESVYAVLFYDLESDDLCWTHVTLDNLLNFLEKYGDRLDN